MLEPNPHDPIITFLGTRKARARGPSDVSALYSFAHSVLALSSSALAFTPAPPVPSDPSAQNSDTVVPMLQSLHQGLCLVMQSIHNVAQHWPIIGMEDFMAQVAWPGVHPSPLGGGEAPTAQ